MPGGLLKDHCKEELRTCEVMLGVFSVSSSVPDLCLGSKKASLQNVWNGAAVAGRAFGWDGCRGGCIGSCRACLEEGCSGEGVGSRFCQCSLRDACCI